MNADRIERWTPILWLLLFQREQATQIANEVGMYLPLQSPLPLPPSVSRYNHRVDLGERLAFYISSASFKIRRVNARTRRYLSFCNGPKYHAPGLTRL